MNLDLISSTQSSKEITANALFDAASPAMAFARRAAGCVALTWAYYGADLLVDGVTTSIPNGTLALVASATNFVEVDRAGAVSSNSAGFTPGRRPLYQVATGAATQTSYTDMRDTAQKFHGVATVAMADADKTLTAAQSRCDTVVATGALTAARAVVVPAVAARYTVRNLCTGFAVAFKTSTGAGVSVGVGKAAIVESDGVELFRLTADV